MQQRLRGFRSNWDKFYGIAVSAIGMTIVAIALQRSGALQSSEKAALDLAFQMRPKREQFRPPVTVITIDESDLRWVGQWPLSDARLAFILRQVQQAQPSVIGLNLHRDLPVQPGSDELEDIFASAPNLIGIRKVQHQQDEVELSAPNALTIRGQVAASDLLPDRDGKLRRHLVSLQDQNRQVVLSLGARLAIDYLQQRGVGYEFIGPQADRVRLGRAVFRALSAFDGGYADADVGGYQILSNFHTSPKSFEQLSLTALLEGSFSPQQLRDRIVLIGAIAPSLQHAFFTPTTRTPAEAWAGVELQADLAAQMVMAALDGRSLLRGVPESLNWLWILFWSLTGALLGTYRPTEQVSLLWFLPVVLAGLTLTGYGLFLGGWWISVAAPAIALGGAALLCRRLALNLQLLQTQTSLLHFQSALNRSEQSLRQTQISTREKDAEKDAFVARMSHELRTPLNAILGFSRMMAHDSRLARDQKENLAIINTNGEYLMAMLNEVLDLSKMGAKQLSLSPSAVDLSDFIVQLEELFQLQIQEKGLILKVNLAPELPSSVWLDEMRLRQVLINLISNALKFTEQGQIVLSISHRTHNILFEVKDTGPGIPQEELCDIFEPFVQGPVFNHGQPGSGLGLSISQAFVQLMGGQLEVQSKLGEGSKFFFELPLKPAQRENLASPSSIIDPSNSDPANLGQPPIPMPADYRILVVDDGPFNRKLLSKMLRDAGYQVQESTNGRTALETWESWHPHLILLDIQMPEMNGYEVAQYIRHRELAGRAASEATRLSHRIGIIAISAGISREEKADAIAAGCDELLPKPFRREELMSTVVRNLLRHGESSST